MKSVKLSILNRNGSWSFVQLTFKASAYVYYAEILIQFSNLDTKNDIIELNMRISIKSFRKKKKFRFMTG